ncbi:hypothetical protein G6F59_017249 [Rhizopus arrhizus]|nr:hypothetical protein G6F59_017249 [Rhizopus arrhizus]
MANAETIQGADVDELKAQTIMGEDGPTLKRFMARAKGRGTRILKRTSHITVVVGAANRPESARNAAQEAGSGRHQQDPDRASGQDRSRDDPHRPSGRGDRQAR